MSRAVAEAQLNDPPGRPSLDQETDLIPSIGARLTYREGVF
jgi:hypothetical protein